MQRAHATLAAAVVAGAVAASVGACTSGLDECGDYPHAGCPGYTGEGGGAASTSSAPSSSGTGGTAPDCSGDPTQDPAIVSDACGVFVSATAASGGDGTREKPFQDIADGFAQAKTSARILFVCAEAYTATSTVRFDSAVRLFGDLGGCAKGAGAWAFADPKTTRASLTGPVDQVALVLESPSGAIDLVGLDVTAPDAQAAGGSSIAVYVNGGTANLTSCTFTAGAGQAGVNGADASTTAAAAGANGANGADACTADTVAGAQQTTNLCAAATPSIGGKGGDGDVLNGGSGGDGLPVLAGGQAGEGDDGSAGWTCAMNGNGSAGSDGAIGDDGLGGTAFGALDTTGFVGAAGGDGQPGGSGQGGGGGGGVRGSVAACGGKAGSGGASGGAGGSGGCGGAPGKGGQGGGASIALVSDQATVTLSSVTLKAGAGGNGGDGGAPQVGGMGSMGGFGGTTSGLGTLHPGCIGGSGGGGGSGGVGAGGRGGHSIGIATRGVTPTYDPTMVTVSMAGLGGLGGVNDADMNHGAPGEASACFDVATNAACQ